MTADRTGGRKPCVGDRVTATLRGTLVAFDDELGAWTLQTDGSDHVPWQIRLHWAQPFEMAESRTGGGPDTHVSGDSRPPAATGSGEHTSGSTSTYPTHVRATESRSASPTGKVGNGPAVVSPVQGEAVETGENACQQCGRDNPVWFAPNEVWNAVMGNHAGFLCPACFIARAEQAGIVPTAWELRPEVLAPVAGSPVPRKPKTPPTREGVLAMAETEGIEVAVDYALSYADDYKVPRWDEDRIVIEHGWLDGRCGRCGEPLPGGSPVHEGEHDIYAEIAGERARAHAKHGDTSMESFPALDPSRYFILAEEFGEVAREFNDARHDNRQPDLVKLRCELIQTAAMAAAWADRLTGLASS